jgi:hypothetical protein
MEVGENSRFEDFPHQAAQRTEGEQKAAASQDATRGISTDPAAIKSALLVSPFVRGSSDDCRRSFSTKAGHST